MSSTIPRRNQLNLMIPAEIKIREAMLEVEKMGASGFLTAAVIHLQNAQANVADYVDGQLTSTPPDHFGEDD